MNFFCFCGKITGFLEKVKQKEKITFWKIVAAVFSLTLVVGIFAPRDGGKLKASTILSSDSLISFESKCLDQAGNFDKDATGCNLDDANNNVQIAIT